MNAKASIEEGIYLEQIRGKVGTGHTAKDAITENFWYCVAQENGTILAKLLDFNDEPMGYQEEVPFEEFETRFTYQPDYKPRRELARQEEADKIAARGERHLENKEYFSAEYEFGSALEKDEKNVRANFGLGETYLAQGDTEKAKEQFGKLSQVDAITDSRYKHIFNEFGIKLRQLGMYGEAVRHYERALKLEPKDENLWFNLARALFEGGKGEKAGQALTKAMELNPDFAEAKLLMEGILASQK
jgi:tetratricopeptide (TPR) repeat protein